MLPNGQVGLITHLLEPDIQTGKQVVRQAERDNEDQHSTGEVQARPLKLLGFSRLLDAFTDDNEEVLS